MRRKILAAAAAILLPAAGFGVAALAADATQTETHTIPFTLAVGGKTITDAYTLTDVDTIPTVTVTVTAPPTTTQPPPTTTTQPPPSSSGTLQWSPPTLSNPQTITITSSNRIVDLTAGQDYIVKLPATPIGRNTNRTLPAVWIRGGRNIVMVGGEIRIDELAAAGDSNYHQRGLMLSGQTGTAHIEGVWIHGNGVGQAITSDNSRGNAGTIQIQNSRLESLHPVWHTADGDPNEIHTDTFQTWNGPTVLRLYQDTFISNGTDLLLQPRQYSSHPLGTWDYRRVNFIHQTADSYALWKQGGPWPEYHEDLWVKVNPNHPWASQQAAWANNGTCWACWNPGGSWPITGQAFNIGLRPAGDFVPVGVAGTNYVSPGYK
jgi:hypothetical protein